MATAQGNAAGDRPGGATRDVEFALDRFVNEGGRLIVEGRWYGVMGRRFVRPVLQVEGRRRIIAVLDHKPWRPDEGQPWIAAFPYEGKAGPSRLQVAPDIAVEIPGSGPRAGDGKPRPARLVRPPVERTGGRFVREQEEERPAATVTPIARAAERDESLPAAEPVDLLEPARDDLRRAEAERDAAREEARRLEAERDAARAEAEKANTERDQARAAAERARAEREAAITELDGVRRERDQAAAQAERFRAEADKAQGDAEASRAEGERAEQLREDVRRLQSASDRALAERNAANDELERLRRSRQPYVAPRPLGQARRPDWRVRTVAIALMGLLAYLLVTLLVAVF